jgi:protein-tyrosine phosphatase
MEMDLPRRLTWEACYNIRDLGGYRTEDGKTTRWGAFVRSDNLYRLNQAGKSSLVDYGVRSIIDLRGPDELLATPNPFAGHPASNGSVRYINIPIIAGENEAAFEALKRAQSNLEAYQSILEGFSERFAAVFKTIAHADPGGVLFHCHAGKDRTGLTSMLLLSLAHVPEDTIAADYILSDRYLSPLYEEILAGAPEDPNERERFRRSLLAEEAYIRSSLNFLKEKYGGVEQYLVQSGVTRQEIEMIRLRIVNPDPSG